MKAFHGQQEIKNDFLQRVRAHAAADEIVQGIYWEHGKGCAVGCTVHSGDHRDYESQLGIPSMVARTEDRLFEGLAPAEAKTFPERFLEAVPVGADLTKVPWQLALEAQRHNARAVDAEQFPEAAEILEKAIILLKSHLEGEGVASAARQLKAAASRMAAIVWSKYCDANRTKETDRKQQMSELWARLKSAQYISRALYRSDFLRECDLAHSLVFAFQKEREPYRSASWKWAADTFLELLRQAPVNDTECQNDHENVITEEQRRAYINAGGSYCPYCKSSNIEARSPELEDERIHQTVDCDDCGRTWVDTFTLTYVEGE